MNPMEQLAALLPECEDIAWRAGQAILEVYNSEFAVEHKDDKSPLTAADLAADKVIAAGLEALGMNWPLISEEVPKQPFEIRQTWDTYWLIDPLDGTREFIKRNGEFTVNIALIHRQEVILGVVHAPVSNKSWSAAKGQGAFSFATQGNANRQTIHSRELEMKNLTVAASRSHANDSLKAFIKKIQPSQTITSGSSIKLCLVASGEADLYARLGPTSEWDTAAAQCVVEEAGGYLTDTDMKQLRYNTKDSLLNPDFFVFGKTWKDWSEYL